MEIILALLVIVLFGTLIYFNRSTKNFDVNSDGKVDAEDAKAAVKNVVEGVKKTADVNKDGKVDKEDAKEVVKKAKTAAKKATTKKTNSKKTTK